MNKNTFRFTFYTTLVLAGALALPVPLISRGQDNSPPELPIQEQHRERDRERDDDDVSGFKDGDDDGRDEDRVGRRGDQCAREPRGEARGHRRRCPRGVSSGGVARGDFNLAPGHHGSPGQP